MAMALDPDVLLPTQFAATQPLDREVALAACRNEQQDRDVDKFEDLAKRPSHVSTLSAGYDVECETSPRWQALILPRGRRHELRAAMVDAEGVCWGALAIYRRERARFSLADLEAVAGLLPARASHLARSMVHARAPGTPESPTSLLIDRTGAVIDAAERAVRWLDETARSDPLDRVAMLLASLAARVRSVRERGDQPPSVRVRMRSAGGAWTSLIAEPWREPGPHWAEDARGIPVIVMATDTAQLYPLQVAAFGLSEREAEVAQIVLEGRDTKAVAKQLSISALTVQDHLKSIFQKTGVHSRRELVYLLGRPNPGA
jgi:DNA-binding CsgD family transcriptional regulator